MSGYKFGDKVTMDGERYIVKGAYDDGSKVVLISARSMVTHHADAADVVPGWGDDDTAPSAGETPVGALRVLWLPRGGAEHFHQPVNSIAQGRAVMVLLDAYDQHVSELRRPALYTSGTVQRYNGAAWANVSDDETDAQQNLYSVQFVTGDSLVFVPVIAEDRKAAKNAAKQVVEAAGYDHPRARGIQYMGTLHGVIDDLGD